MAETNKIKPGTTVKHKGTGVFGTVRSITTIGEDVFVDVDWAAPQPTVFLSSLIPIYFPEECDSEEA